LDVNAQLARIRAALRRLFSADQLSGAAIEEWLNTPAPAFSGLSPTQLAAQGHTDTLWWMIRTIESLSPLYQDPDACLDWLLPSDSPAPSPAESPSASEPAAPTSSSVSAKTAASS
jgi:hypothetical protein